MMNRATKTLFATAVLAARLTRLPSLRTREGRQGTPQPAGPATRPRPSRRSGAQRPQATTRNGTSASPSRTSRSRASSRSRQTT